MLTTSDTTPSATTMPAGIAGSVRSNTEQAVARPTRPADFTPDDVLTAHRGGKLSVSLRAPLANRRDLSMLYTPGVAEPCLAIQARPDRIMRVLSCSDNPSAWSRTEAKHCADCSA